MDTIKILFTRPRNLLDPLAWGIRLLTWSPYCHAAMQFETQVFQATGDGASFTKRSEFDKKNKVIAEFELSSGSGIYKNLYHKAKTLKGTPYDYAAIAGLAMYRLGVAKHNPAGKGKGTLFCSELLYYMLVECAIIDPHAEPEMLDPKKLLRYLEEAAKTHRFITRLF